ncbi:calmodulin-binding transcription activator 2 isoform X3 [Tribolium castaneum]|uniref:calmodulin-binding transcription activator 2 isoform X3 n=1 Tax=Tribolium castaneum TaxID=7070 RepID=UPI0030FEAC5D
MASPAVFCVNLQLNPNNSISSQVKETKNDKPMHNTNAKLVRALTNNLTESRPSGAEVNRGNIIFVRGAKTSDGGHILLRTDSLPTSKTTSLVLEESDHGKLGQIFIQQSDIGEGVLLQSVKRLGGGTPIFLLSGNDNGNGHFLIQTTSAEDVHSVADIGEEQPGDNILLQALEGLHDNETSNGRGISTPIGSDGEPIKLPENLESLPRADHFPTQRHRWNTNEEIAAILISFDRHAEWQSKEVKIRPKSGSMLLYSRKKVRYRRDGYCWKKRKDGKTTREDHMKLKVQGTECIYGCYVHSAILPTFHRRCYWLLQNPDIVLVHYLNVPYPDDNKLAVITPSLALWADKKEWTKDELVSQLKPMFFSEDEPDLNNELEISNFKLQTAETVEAIVSQLMEKQRVARQAALVKQLECGCPDSTCADGKSCSHPMRRITSAKDVSSPLPSSSSNSRPPSSADNNNQVSSTTGSGSMLLNNNSPRVYSRESRNQNCSSSGNTPPLVLSLSQIQGGGGLLILNSSNSTSPNNTNQNLVTPVSVANFVRSGKNEQRNGHLVLKQEVMDTNPSSCCHPSSKDKMNQKMEVNDRQVFEGISYGRHHQTEVVMSSAPSTPSKHMDTSHEEVIEDYKHHNFGETVVLLGTDSSGSLVSKSDGSSIINGGFFNETLDLSQEDIQRTLSANMPLCSSELNGHQRHNSEPNPPNRPAKQSAPQNMTQEINPMDFIDSCDVVVSPTHVVDDDVFVNLDAFDMLGEFPDLEGLDSGQAALLDVHPSENRHEKAHAEHPSNNSMEGSAKITDYSPEWAYPEGGVKVLVTGPWHSSGPYTVLFDTFPVPTTLVQSGVLRCYCPAHEAGLATLQVACDGYVISNSVIFEYKLPPREEQVAAPEPKIERSNDNLLKFTLLQRLEAMDDRLQIKQEPTDGSDCVEDTALFCQANFEDRLVGFCQNMTSRIWSQGEELSVSWFASHRGMTLLHLAASLGYSRLVCALLHWRAENSSLLLETEVDALSQDEDGYTPLMWACARGHTETAIMLYKWNHTALNMKNTSNQTALECAKSNNHNELVKELEKLELRRDKANMMLHNSFSTESPTVISPASSVASLNSSKSHDGVFLRPGAVTRSESQKYKMLNIDLDSDNIIGSKPSPLLSDSSASTRGSNGQKLIKRPSIDSGIHMSCGSSESTKSKNSRLFSSRLSKFDRSMSLPLSTRENSFDSEPPESGRRMDFALCEIGSGPRSSSPLIDVEAVSDDESDIHNSTVGEQDARVLTLAEQIIAAMPDRIKNESEDMLLDTSPGPPEPNDTLSDVFMEPLLDQSSSSFESNEFNFEFSDHNYRYYDVGTPCSSLSPASSSCLQSPCSFTLDSPSPPPTTADFCEFFQASGSLFEKDFSNLTLSDREQRELYEAAKIIQKAYRSYKGRLQQEQDKERTAAIVIQNYYRRYKQYAYYKQMTHAAMVIQNGYRSYCEHKRFKKSQEAAVCIQNYYRNYKEQGGRGSREGTPASGLKRTYSQRRQHQAARKIQQFMRQSKNNLWDETMGSVVTERTSRKREAGGPVSGCPSKVTVSRGLLHLHRPK